MADEKDHEDEKSDVDSEKTPENDENMVNGDGDDSEFDDPEGFVDDITDEELLGDILSQRPKEIEGTESIIVVDNIPSVGQERCEKLKNVIRKVFSKFGKIVTEYYPMSDGLTKGYMFLEFSNPNDAARAVKTANGYKLDKHHVFAVNHFEDFMKLLDPHEDWKPPAKQEYTQQENLRSWLQDPDCNDQYSVIHGDKTSILWNSSQEPMMVKERPNWTETYVLWSPKGTYLATFHGQGVALWGGEEFKRIMRFSHPGVQLIDFSPCERYLVSFSPIPSSSEDPSGIIIWDIRTGLKRRGFLSGDTSQWPAFKWSHNGKYFARMATDSISVYETPSFGLIDKKSLKVEGVKDFQWSPSDNYIAYWTPEDKDTPARVTIMQIPDRKEIRVKNLFNVSECKMYWHNKGDYLAVKVDRNTKSKKALYFNFELFRMRERQIPVESLEMKEAIIAFAWEPGSSKFCILHGEAPRISASFYDMEIQGSVELQKTYERRQANNIFWSPNGQFCVLAGLQSMNGILEFHDTTDWVCMNQAEHFMATDVEWDPTGRFVATSVSWWAHKVDNGYFIWSFQGKLLQRHVLDQFCQLLWRPRPPTLLDEEAQKKLKKEMKKYQKTFEIKDRMSQSRASKEIIERRRRKLKEFEVYRQKKITEYQETKRQRMDLRQGLETDSGEGISKEVDVERIEFFVKEEVIEVEE
ncbi:eukaryotic translation initiation factor 3 subunit B-like [Actinia tenebrosa]|uniref:Eukaryotic translation initiation factor 3 subunit B n=1 Tax=Actinia tenebrosa TaxID=6105 RepID=A0A6P8HUI6_ACTTE|nr:eukaryotic translation initiation factor 3 subunit B-like [Actinia tenebrosa]